MAAVLFNGVSKLCSCVHFAAYVFTATIINGIAIFIAIQSKMQDFGSCKGTMWMLVNAIPCAAHIVAAWYLSISLQRRNVIGVRESVLGRTFHMLCYDPWMAIYFLIVLFYFAWMWPGGAWFATDALQDGGGCSDDVRKFMSVVITCNFTFISIGVTMFIASLIISYCYDHVKGGSSKQYDQQQYAAYSEGSKVGTKVEPTLPTLPAQQAQVYGGANRGGSGTTTASTSQPLTQYQQERLQQQDMSGMSPAEAHAAIMAASTATQAPVVAYQPPYQAAPYDASSGKPPASNPSYRADVEMGNMSSPPMAEAVVIDSSTPNDNSKTSASVFGNMFNFGGRRT